MTEENKERFGEYLRKQREIRGFSLEEISDQTKISLRALKAIEAEDWELLPAEIYIRGFIRCYCETIGLDPNEALLRFEEAYLPYKRQKEDRRYHEEYVTGSRKFPFKWLIVLALIMLAAALGYFFYFKKTESPPAPASLPSLETPKETEKTEAPAVTTNETTPESFQTETEKTP